MTEILRLFLYRLERDAAELIARAAELAGEVGDDADR